MNFCALFWGVVFSPLVTLFRLVAGRRVAQVAGASVARHASHRADHISAWSHRHPRVALVFPGVWACAILAYAGYGIYEWVLHPLWGLVVFGCIVAGLGIILGSIASVVWFSMTDRGESFGQWVKRVTVRLGAFGATAYHAIKDRTCPRIRVIE